MTGTTVIDEINDALRASATEDIPSDDVALSRLLEAFPESIVGETIPNEKTKGVQPPIVAIVSDPPAPDEGMLAFAQSIMNGEPLELRVLGHRDGTLSGVFATPEELAAAAAEINGDGDIYVTPNPITLEPRTVRVIGNGEGAGNEHVSRIRWFLVDVDVYNDDGATAMAVAAWLKSMGFPDPLMQDSGNGHQLWYRYDGPNTKAEATLRQRALGVLAERFPGIDISCSNAARIMRYAGTMNLNRKKRGDGKPKPSRLLSPTGAVLEVLSRERLEALAAMAPAEAAPMTPDQGVRADLEPIVEKLAELGIELRNPHPARGNLGTIHDLTKCPFYPNGSPNGVHSGAALWEWADGHIGFRCQGNSCIAADHRILDLLKLLGLAREVDEPDDHDDRGVAGVPTRTRIEIPRLDLDAPDPGPPAYYLNPFLPKGAIIAPLGMTGSSKTFVMRMFALKLAEAGVKVFYLSEDMSKEKDRSFLERTTKGLLMEPWKKNLFWSPRHGANLANAGYREALLGEVIDFGTQILFLDTFTRIYAGHLAATRESWDVASAFTSLVTNVQAKTGATIVPIFHPPKGSPRSLPGGTAIEGAVDEIILFQGEYHGGYRSDFTVETQKNTRYPHYAYQGKILGEEDEVSPLALRLEPVGKAPRPFLPSTGKLLIDDTPPGYPGGGLPSTRSSSPGPSRRPGSSPGGGSEHPRPKAGAGVTRRALAAGNLW
jgi:hypothetical protein